MLLSGGSIDDFLAAHPLAHVDPADLWTPGYTIAPPAEAQSPLSPVEGAFSEGDDPLAAFTYDTLANGMPILHSRPGAPASLFIDFDGYDPEGWLPFTQDADGSTFNATEQATIVETWRQTEAFYSMFDIDVTTIQPDVDTQPTAWHVLTPSYKSGGLAWDIFPNTTPGSLSDGDWSPFNLQAVVAHETGHTFGCGHVSEFDQYGNNIEVYATFDDPLRGTIMGGTGQPINTWYLWHADPWHNPGGPSYLQDDVAYIAKLIDSNAPAGYTGDGYRPDDYSGTTATPLAASGTTQSITGIIERLTDVDRFSFAAAAAGRYSLALTREEPANVDLKVSIYDESGVLLAAEDDDPRDKPTSVSNDQYLTLDLPAGTYYAVVESHGDYSDLGKYNLRVDPLPAAWTLDNVGINARGGYATHDSGTYTLAGAGYFVNTSKSSSIGGTNDSFQYLYQTLEGDGSITVRVTNGATQNPMAGVMIRDSLDSTAKSASVVLQGTNRAYFLSRSAVGGTTTSSYGTATATYYVRLTRTGDVFRAYRSSTGVNWTQIGGDRTIAMGETVYIGLVSTARVSSTGSSSAPTNHALNVATFTNVDLTGTLNPAPTLNALTPPSNLTITGKTASTISLSWTDTAGETGYTVERSTDAINYTAVGTTDAGVAAYIDSTLTDPVSGLPLYQRYFYRVRAQGDGGTVSQPSAVVNDVPRAGPASEVVVSSIVSSSGSPQMVIDWRDASGETGYRVERSLTGTGGWTTVKTVGRNVPSATDTSVAFGAEYYYRVVTLDGSGDAGISQVVSRYSRLAAPSGLVFTAKEPYRMAFQWNAVTGAARYKVERSTNGSDYTTLASALTATSYTDNNISPVTEYHYRVTALNDNALGIGRVIFAAAPAASSLPTPWLTQDIGAVTTAGAAKYSNGTFTLIASGDEIFDPTDEFRYVYKPMSGDFSYTARVASVEDTSYWAKAGLMIRETTAVGSKHAMIYISPHLAVFQWRSSTNGYITDTYGPEVTAPYYVRISRSGSTFTGEISPDGTTWTTVGTPQTITISTNVYVGFALTARDDTKLNTSTFTISPPDVNTAPTVATAAAANPNPSMTGTTTLSALGADDHGEPNLTYTWATTSMPSGAATPTYTANRTNAAKTTTATLSLPGDYTFRVTIADTSGASVTSSVTVNYNPTPVVTTITVAPLSAKVVIGTTQQFTATAYDQFGAVLDPQPAFTWSATAGQIDEAGLYTAPAAPTADTVTATSSSVQGTAPLAVILPPPPPPWVAQDVGAVGAAGTVSYEDGVFTIEGSGSNIYLTADEFHFVYQPLAGDGRITARVESIELTGDYAKAGVMMRQTLEAGSMNVATLVTANAGARMQYRAGTGATTVEPARDTSVGDPYWVRLTRTGDSYVSEMSPDGTVWTELGRVTFVMGASVYVGLPVTSFADGTLCTAVVTDVSVLRRTGLPGDADGSGVVDAADAAIMAAHWGRPGMTVFDGDFSADGTVNAADAAILAANWGATLPEAAPPAAATAHDAVLAAAYGPQRSEFSGTVRQRHALSDRLARRRLW